MVTFFLKIDPKATQRSRCACRGRYPSVYTDPKYREWKAQALPLLIAAADEAGHTEPFEGPIKVTTEARFRRPKTTKLAAPRGDNDNIEKGLWDAITQSERWWRDDNQIVDNRTTKRWTREGEEPGYTVTIESTTP